MAGDRDARRAELFRRALVELADAEQHRTWLARLWPDEPLARALVAAAAVHGLTSTLHDRLVALDVTPPEEVALAQQGATARRLAARATLVRLGRALDEAGVPWLTCKGAVVAARHERPEHREFNDLDLLVPGPRLADALDVAATIGVESINRNWSTYLDHGVGELPLVDGTVWIDLHWHLVGLARVRRRFDLDPLALLDRRRRLDLGGVDVPVLDECNEVVHLALHAGLGGGARLCWLRDVRVVIAANRPDWDTLVAGARRAKAATIVGLVLDRSRRLVGAPVPEAVAEALVPRRALWLARRLDRRPASIEVLSRRVGSGTIVRSVRDDPASTAGALANEVGSKVRSLAGRAHRWDVADRGGTLYWGTATGGAADRERYLSMAASA
ncbi:MAG: nucleotidyltransferase family protein [Actinomycetota bacterium]